MDTRSAVLLRSMEARRPPTGVDVERATAEWQESEWQELLRRAEWHRLSGLLHRHVGEVGDAPGWVADELERAYMRQLARSAMVAHTRQAALQGLAVAGIDVMLLKGAALVETVYDDAATRDIGDLDLLIRAGDLDAATGALLDHGFRRDSSPTRRGHAWSRPRPSGRPHGAPLHLADGIVPVELHHHVLESDRLSGAFDIGDFWARARRSPESPPHLLPAPEDLLMHLCLHHTRGRAIRSEGSLAQVRDMAAVIARCELDWERFVANACDYGVAGPTFLALFTLSELEFQVDDRALEALRPAGFDPSIGRQFIARRVLADDLWLPFADWGPSVEGLRTALWWGRRNLAARDGLSAEESRPLLSRRDGFGALMRLAGRSARHPRAVLSDVRISKWLERTV